MDDSLCLDGMSCIIHQQRVPIDEMKHLILWNNDKAVGLYIDKYDCRCLLPDLPKRTVFSNELHEHFEGSDLDMVDVITLTKERYMDMKDRDVEGFGDKLDSSTEMNNGDKHWDYDYNQNEVLSTPFIKPNWIDFPVDMVLPDDQQQYTVILHTIKKFIAAGKSASRLEIMIKVREATNPNSKMLFLLESHKHYPFYMYLKALDESTLWSLMLNKPPEIKTESNNIQSQSETRVAEEAPAGNCLSMVADYGSDSDDSVDNAECDTNSLGGINTGAIAFDSIVANTGNCSHAKSPVLEPLLEAVAEADSEPITEATLPSELISEAILDCCNPTEEDDAMQLLFSSINDDFNTTADAIDNQHTSESTPRDILACHSVSHVIKASKVDSSSVKLEKVSASSFIDNSLQIIPSSGADDLKVSSTSLLRDSPDPAPVDRERALVLTGRDEDQLLNQDVTAKQCLDNSQDHAEFQICESSVIELDGSDCVDEDGMLQFDCDLNKFEANAVNKTGVKIGTQTAQKRDFSELPNSDPVETEEVRLERLRAQRRKKAKHLSGHFRLQIAALNKATPESEHASF